MRATLTRAVILGRRVSLNARLSVGETSLLPKTPFRKYRSSLTELEIKQSPNHRRLFSTLLARNMPEHTQDRALTASIQDPEKFWSYQASQLVWHKKPSTCLQQGTKNLSNGVSHPHWSWFPDGEISTSYNCLDRHVKAGNGNVTAIIWDSPVTGKKEKYTYSQVLEEVETLAGVLREEGVKKGDVVLIYSKYRSSHHSINCIG